MPLVPLVGHAPLRRRISDAIARRSLPASLLLHGPRGSGKERLALWIGARLLCGAPAADGEPCGSCQHCQFVARGVHPDLHWYFPRPKLKDADPDTDDIAIDLAEAIEGRLEKTGVWEAPARTDSIYLKTVNAIVLRATLTPALATRKVIVVADAERLVPQESSQEASNAFLKLLEEPLADTTIILTSSSPSSLLPTIRSRVSAVRVPPLPPEAVRELAAMGVQPESYAGAHASAVTMLEAARHDAASRYRVAMAQGSAGARGDFSETLDALTGLLHQRAREAAERGDDRSAVGAARAVEAVEQAKRLTRQNVNPQLISATLLEELSPLVS